jgi:hypothetical protein
MQGIVFDDIPEILVLDVLTKLILCFILMLINVEVEDFLLLDQVGRYNTISEGYVTRSVLNEDLLSLVLFGVNDQIVANFL